MTGTRSVVTGWLWRGCYHASLGLLRVEGRQIVTF
jgi:hypothetical protein